MRAFGFACVGALTLTVLGAVVVSFGFPDLETMRIVNLLEGCFAVGAVAGGVVGVRTKSPAPPEK